MEKLGFDLDGKKLLPEEKLLETVDWIKEKDPMLYDDIMGKWKKYPDMTFGEFFPCYIEHFDINYEYGLAPLVARLVKKIEGVGLVAEEGVVGLEAGFPWDFEEKAKALDKEEFLQMLYGYACRFVEEPGLPAIYY